MWSVGVADLTLLDTHGLMTPLMTEEEE